MSEIRQEPNTSTNQIDPKDEEIADWKKVADQHYDFWRKAEDEISRLRAQLWAAKEVVDKLRQYRPPHWCMNAPGSKDIPKSQCEACQINDLLSKLEAEQ